jgi:hypothetical protein
MIFLLMFFLLLLLLFDLLCYSNATPFFIPPDRKSKDCVIYAQGNESLFLLRNGVMSKWNTETCQGYSYQMKMVDILREHTNFLERKSNILFLGLGGGIVPVFLAQDHNVTVLENNQEVIDRAPSFYHRMQSCGFRTSLADNLSIILGDAEDPPDFGVLFDAVVVDVPPVYNGTSFASLHLVKQYATENAMMTMLLQWGHMPRFLINSADWNITAVDDGRLKQDKDVQNIIPGVPATSMNEDADLRYRVLTLNRKTNSRITIHDTSQQQELQSTFTTSSLNTIMSRLQESVDSVTNLINELNQHQQRLKRETESSKFCDHPVRKGKIKKS